MLSLSMGFIKTDTRVLVETVKQINIHHKAPQCVPHEGTHFCNDLVINIVNLK